MWPCSLKHESGSDIPSGNRGRPDGHTSAIGRRGGVVISLRLALNITDHKPKTGRGGMRGGRGAGALLETASSFFPFISRGCLKIGFLALAAGRCKLCGRHGWLRTLIHS